MKIIFFSYLFFSCSWALAVFGPSAGTTGCEEMSIFEHQISHLKTGECSVYRTTKGTTRNYLSFFKICPKPFKKMNVYLKSNIMVTDSNGPIGGDIEITNKKSCFPDAVQDMYQNARGQSQIELKLYKLEKGSPLTVLTKMGFFKIRSKDNIWTYHLTPGVSADVEIIGEKCGKAVCLDEGKQKILKVLDVYRDFIRMDKSGKIYYSSALDEKEKKEKQ